MLKGIYIKKDQREFFVRENLKKISIVIKNVIWSEKALIHKAVLPSNFFSNSFTYDQAEQIKKEVLCVQILLEIHLTEHGRFHFQGRNFLHTCLGPTQQAHDIRLTLLQREDIT